MKENFEQKNIFKHMDKAISEAILNPIDINELNLIAEKMKLFTAKGGSEKQREKFSKRLAQSQIISKTLPEYHYVLKQLGLSKERIEEVLKHENAHANMASSLGANHKGYITIVYKDRGRINFRDGTEIAYPEKIDRPEIIRQVAMAPEVYESVNLSTGDKKVINETNKDKDA